MFERLIGKEQVNLTLDKTLVEKLKKLKEKLKVTTLSPFINEILWDWVNKQEENKK